MVLGQIYKETQQFVTDSYTTLFKSRVALALINERHTKKYSLLQTLMNILSKNHN
jgi:hypothetical protein